MSHKDLKSYKNAVIIHDFTVEFCKKYIDPKSRTTDQMIQAARSGKQNIVEGVTNKTWEGTTAKLVAVARASLSELLEDYEDFLRQQNFPQWDKNDERAAEIRKLVYEEDRLDKLNRLNKFELYRPYLQSPEAAANCAICLIHQTNFLLDRQLKSYDQPQSTKFASRTRQEKEGEEWLAEQLKKISGDK